jgi:surface carbohydrate biosynthesis protein
VGNDSFKFGWPKKYGDKGPFWTNVEDEGVYTEILDYLFEISDEEWENVRSNIIDDLMVMDWDNRIIKKVMDNLDIKTK